MFLLEVNQMAFYFFDKVNVKPIAPNPNDLSCSAEYLARLIWSGAWSIKNCNTLSKNVIKSFTTSVSFHSSYNSKFKDDRQQTAVLSSFVGRCISLHKILKP